MYRDQRFRPPRAPLRRQLGELPADAGHGYMAPGWRESSNDALPRQLARSGRFSPAIEVAANTESRLLLALNVRRNYLLVFNVDTTNDLWVNLSAQAAVSRCIKIPPGGSWEPWTVPINDLYVVSNATATAIVVEGSG